MRVLSAVLIAVSLLAAPAFAVDGFLYSRQVQVPAAGWVRVPLDLSAVQHLAPGGADLHVFAPDGGEVPVRVEPAVPRSERKEAKVLKVERGKDGWTLLLDTGPEPVPHERLFFEMSRMASAPSVALEGSPDGETWQTLATGDLFRIGESEGLQQTALSYPSTEDRFLRLAWPEQAGFPRVAAVAVEVVRGPSLTSSTQDTECRETRPAAVACELALPAAGQILRRVTLEVAGKGVVGFRLYEAREARWDLLAEGIWQRSGERTLHFVAGRSEPVAAAVLRLELHGTGAAPRLVSYGADLAVRTALFQAEEPGTYTLAYGSVRRSRPAPAWEGEAAWLEAGPEKAGANPGLPAAIAAPGAPLGQTRFQSSWPVAAPAARPGDLVRLELPDVVYDAARPDLGDLRLALGDRQIPFFRWSPPAPALAAEERGLRPDPIQRTRESEAEVILPAPGLPLTELFLTAPGRPLRRAVGVRYREPEGPLRRREETRERAPVARETWACDSTPPLPCRAVLSLPDPAPKIVSVRLHDGDNPPLASLDAELWRRRDALLFVWPETSEKEPVRLLAGADLTEPVYDFAALGDLLLARPWQPAELALEGDAPKSAPWWSRWVMPAVLAVAGIFLLILLRRILAEH
ncbi:MAG TPA: DUF3999 family protein [Thermoanaerobaculia bacterium]